MALPYLVYKKAIKDDFKQLPFEKLLFLGVWCCEYMDNKYGSYLNELGHEKEHKILTDAVLFLWSVIDNPSIIEDAVIKKQLKVLRNIDIDGLDFAKPKDCGILKIMEGIENTLTYIQKKDIEDIFACTYYPLDVLNAVMNSKLDPYTTPMKSGIDDPFFKEELDAQKKLVEYLQSNEKLTSADKHIFRD
ncbi:hypothetical protein SAMN05518672_104276 [Chitinophaga sp. CF118]|uniref:hypothetical protein n=1 Tax=Chitinophaga sp. CF118 TaxID=1884367 RepID=UPI0008E70C72|nr:hypothetical protein [Chitinophaga sp. CF118]SFE05133.1 hypothetical protein SAMN05518672_104276 [Chitinophaga sp. CF118]